MPCQAAPSCCRCWCGLPTCDVAEAFKRTAKYLGEDPANGPEVLFKAWIEFVEDLLKVSAPATTHWQPHGICGCQWRCLSGTASVPTATAVLLRHVLRLCPRVQATQWFHKLKEKEEKAKKAAAAAAEKAAKASAAAAKKAPPSGPPPASAKKVAAAPAAAGGDGTGGGDAAGAASAAGGAASDSAATAAAPAPP